MASLGELDTFGAFEQGRGKRSILGDVPEEHFPPGAVPIAQRLHVRQLLPLLVEVHRLRPFRVEEWLGRGDQRLHKAAVETAYSRAERAVDLNLQQVVALDTARTS